MNLFIKDARLTDSNLVFLVWNAKKFRVFNPKKWTIHGQTWYVSPGTTKQYIYLYKNSKTRFTLNEKDQYIVSPSGSVLLGNHISFGISRLRDKKAAVLKTHYTTYKKEYGEDIWARNEARCDITFTALLNSSQRACEEFNEISKRFEKSRKVFATKYRAAQLDIINAMVSIIQKGPESLSSASASGGAPPNSLLYDRNTWKKLNELIIQHPLIYTSDLQQVTFIDDRKDQITCHCDYVSGHRRVFAIDLKQI